jgi:hypothetical protein
VIDTALLTYGLSDKVVIDTARGHFDGLSVREVEKVVIDTALLTHGLSDKVVIDTARGHFDGLSV